MSAQRVNFTCMRFQRSFLSVFLAVMTLVMPLIPPGLAVAADNPGNAIGEAANTELLPAPLNMSAMESTQAQIPVNLSLFNIADDIAEKVENADQSTEAKQETGKYAGAFSELFGKFALFRIFGVPGIFVYDCVAALLQDMEASIIEAYEAFDISPDLALLPVDNNLERALEIAKEMLFSSVSGAILDAIETSWKISSPIILPIFIIESIAECFSRVKVKLPPKSVCTDLKHAAFAWGAYGEEDPLKEILPFPENLGWEESETVTNDAISYSSTVYKHYNMQGELDEVIVAFKGTTFTDGADWTNNLINGLGGIAPQYLQAAEEAKRVMCEYPGAKISFTGHSLGGGLAQYAAAVTNQRAVTFNTASPSKFLLEHKGIDIDSVDFENLITNYFHQNDPLHKVNLITGDEGWTFRLGKEVKIDGSEEGIFPSHSIKTMWKYFAKTCITPLSLPQDPPWLIINRRGTIVDDIFPKSTDLPPEFWSDILPSPIINPGEQLPVPGPSQPEIGPWKPDFKKSDKQDEYKPHNFYNQLVK